VKKSFRWHLFIRIIIATVVVFAANRIIAQYLTSRHIVGDIEQNIADTLDKCRNDTHDLGAFLKCAARNNRGRALTNITEYYIVCNRADSATAHDPVCAQTTVPVSTLRGQPKNVGTAVRLERRKIDGDEWLIFSIIDDAKGPLLMIRHYDVEAYVDSVYDLRNRILRYLAPVIILLLILMTYYMTSVVMRPIRQLENSLAGLTSSNLDKPIDVLPPYREFDRFVTVFEQLRERLNQSFVQTRRFAADASHELRTPLTILRGNSERLIAELPTGSDQQIRMRLIGDEIERLIEITEKLLLLSRADANSIRYDMETVSLSTMITELALDAMAFQPSLKIHSDVEPHVLCRCDRSLMHQLVHNLYTNAAKYNAANGWIRFSLTCQQDRYTLIVENPCDNIPADLVERAFQRFYRGDAARGREIDGIGLGLSLSREIARLHQATLSLRVTDQNTVVATLEAPLSPTKL
jgi:signal transduction histidine kinase